MLDPERCEVSCEARFSVAVADKLAAWARGEGPPELTQRELEVLQQVVQGLSNKKIAHEMGVKERTVEYHVGNVLKKLGVASRVEAALWAKEHGMV